MRPFDFDHFGLANKSGGYLTGVGLVTYLVKSRVFRDLVNLVSRILWDSVYLWYLKEATIGKMGYFRILQMQVTDPWEVLSAFSGNNTSLTRGIKQLFDALNTARSCEDALERIYSCDVPFFLPLCPIILSEENLNVGAKDKVKKDEQNKV
uniref:Uncharacterized protein n=1 Tax=Meloidogyne enterolobii TaxID=390850 RepID=A0A6V7U706_MELEN|nr:unnamed protein product [Meloidogyne enterolobii]